MKNNVIYIALIIGIIFCSISAISATDNDMVLNQGSSISLSSDEISASNDSNVYSINNIDINNVEKSVSRGENIQTTQEINNNKISTNFVASDMELYYKNGTRFEGWLLDNQNNPITEQNVIITINKVSYTKTTDMNGKFSMAIDLNSGNYPITLRYNGSEDYEGCSYVASVKVLPVITGEDVVKYYRNGTQYYATFLDGHGDPLANTTIKFNINGVFYTKTTNESGVAKLTIDLFPKTYIITAYHPNGYKYSNLITVLSTIEGNNLVKAFQDNHQYYATFLNGDGTPLVGTDIIFNINGVFYTRTTNESGVAKLTIDLFPKTYIITAYHPVDGLRASNIITVLSGVNTNIESNGSAIYEKFIQTISVVLYDEIGYTVPNQQVSALINNIMYNDITNDKGIASFNVNLTAGSYDVLYQYDGNNVYKASNAKNTIAVLKNKETNITVTDNVVFKGDDFIIIVKDLDDNPIANLDVVFKVNGISYHGSTDSNGKARLNIKLNKGLYNITYYVNQVGYDDKSYTTTIGVITTDVPSISTTTTEVYYGEEQSFDALVLVDGIPLVNQTVKIAVNGVTYERVTNENGVAYLSIELYPKEYVVTVSYEGNSKFKPASRQFLLKVLDLTSTKFTVIGGPDIVKGNNFNVKLLDYNNNPLVDKNVVFTINGVNYTKTTDGEGIASIKINLTEGKYNINYKFAKEYPYGGCEQSSEIRVMDGTANNNAYWVFGANMLDVDLASLAKQGTGNIFLNFAAFSTHGEAKVVSWIKKANSYGIKVHIWMQAFYYGEWTLPALDDGTPNYSYFNKRITEAKYYAGLEGVSGIHLDYLRVPGTAYKHPGSAAAINEFVKLLSESVRAINPNIILSAAVMPETTNNIYYYGQDIPTLGKYLDVIVPMVYKGNYKAGDSWITSTTKWFVDNANGAQIWTGLQAYKSDNDLTLLSVKELTGDAQAAINGGASGIVIFRWGVTNFIDFNSIDHPVEPVVPTGTEFTTAEIVSAAQRVKTFMEENGVLPNYVTIRDIKCSMGQFLYLLAKFVPNYKTQSKFAVIDVAEPASPATNSIRGKLYESDYRTIANSIVSYIDTYKSAPGSMPSSLGTIPYSALIYGYSKIVAYVGNNNALPAFVYVSNIVEDYSLTVIMMPSVSTSQYKYIKYQTTWLSYCPKCGYYGTLLDNPKHVYEGEITCHYCDADFCGVTGKEKISSSNVYLTRLTQSVPVDPVPVSSAVSLKDIEKAAIYVKGYYEANQEIPDTITISDGKFSTAQYLYLVSKAIDNIAKGNFSDISIMEVSDASNPSGSQISSQLDKEEFLDLAQRVAKFIENYEQAPNYASSPVGTIIYDELVDSLSRVLAYYSNNGALPNYVTIKWGSGSSKTIADLASSLVAGLTSTEARATALFNYVRDYIGYEFYYNTKKGAEGTLASGAGNCCDQAQLLVAMARSVGLTVRFATGTCTFSSGSTYGHVWVQFSVGGKWVNADPTSTRNSFGVIKNWNTNSYVNKGTFDVLPY